MEIPIIKIHNMAFFPHEKFYIRSSEETSKVVNVGNFIGVVYSKSQSSIKEIGTICKIISVQSNLFSNGNGRNLNSNSKILLQGISRIRIKNYEKPGDKSIFIGKVEVLEDEISILNYKFSKSGG